MASKGENTKDTHTEDTEKPEKNKEESNNVKEDKKDKEVGKENSDATSKDPKKDTEDSNSTNAMKETTSNKKAEKGAESNDDKEKDQKKTSDTKDPNKVSIPDGKGTPLGEIPRIDASISRFKNEDLKLLHQFLFEFPGKTTIIKKNIKKFNGFDFAKGTDEYKAKVESAEEFEVKQLKSICEMLDLEKRGSKNDIVERIMDFLMEPKDSGKVDGGGRPKRSAAVKANNRGYSSHDESYSSDERPSPRSRRDKGKRSNLKDESSSESDEDFNPSDSSEEKPRARRRGAPRKKRSEDEDSNEDDAADSFDESEDEVKSKKKKSAATPAKATSGRGRGRRPASAAASPNKRKAPARGAAAKKPKSESEESGNDSSEDEPLIKKAKSADPPTDEEIKSYVKDILDGANLEEITMKTVCKQVYAHYPDFDLTHKKDYIKTTVKSLIST